MKNIYVKDLINKCKGSLLIGSKDVILNDFSKDTRTIQKGEVYIGIKGKNFDGNTLYKEAIEKGAVGCILNKGTIDGINDLKKYANIFIVEVEDTVKALGLLAAYKRSLYDIPVIAVTGSVGKTSTKDVIASVLSEKYHVLKTMGNFNNEIGLPLTILSLKDHDALVLEMGMNNFGEIKNLSLISKPTIAIITNIGTSHIGNLGSRENILKAKLEILTGMENKILFINNDNDLLHDFYLENKDKYKIITFGITNKSDYLAQNIKLNETNSTYEINLNNNKYSITVNTPGDAFILNTLGAFAIGDYLGISPDLIKKGISNFSLSNNRMNIEKINNITLINDVYNASVDSMNVSLKYLGMLTGRKIAVLGDMLELGIFSENLHRQVGKFVFENKIDVLVTVGEYAKYIKDECLKLGFNKNNIYTYTSNKDAYEFLKNYLKSNDNVLFKASNGMNFIEIYSLVKEAIK